MSKTASSVAARYATSRALPRVRIRARVVSESNGTRDERVVEIEPQHVAIDAHGALVVDVLLATISGRQIVPITAEVAQTSHAAQHATLID